MSLLFIVLLSLTFLPSIFCENEQKDASEEISSKDEPSNELDEEEYFFENGEIYTSILKSGKIRIGVSRYYPPLHNTIQKNGKLHHYGAEIRMAKSLGKFLGVQVETIPLDMKDYVPSLQKRQVDVLIAGLSRNLKRGKEIWFSDPYYRITPGVLVDTRILPQTNFGDEFEEDPFRTIWDLKRLPDFTYAVKRDSSYADLIKEKFPGQKIKYVSTNEEGLQLLLSNKVHGFVHDSIFLKYQYEKTPEWKNRYLLLRGGPLVEEISVGLPIGDCILKAQIDFWISEILRQNKIEDWMKEEEKNER